MTLDQLFLTYEDAELEPVCCRPQALLLLCEFIINSTRAPPSEDALYHTLLQLYLADEADLKSQQEPGPTASQETRRCFPNSSDIFVRHLHDSYLTHFCASSTAILSE